MINNYKKISKYIVTSQQYTNMFILVYQSIVEKRPLKNLTFLKRIFHLLALLQQILSNHIYPEIKNMINNSFQFVNHSQLNNSKAKQAHRFSKAVRFTNAKPSNCSQSSYDLSRTMMNSTIMKKPSIISRDTRFKSSATISPSPDSYNRHSFTDHNGSKDRGHSFSHADKLVNRSKTHLFPGPGAHQPVNNLDKKLSYTMRSKVKVIDNRPVLNILIRKQVQGTMTQLDFKPLTNLIKQVQNMQIQRQQSQEQQSRTIRSYQNLNKDSRIKSQFSEVPNYSFGHVSKQPFYIKKNTVPGPGSYNKFSQFSQLKYGNSRSIHTITHH